MTRSEASSTHGAWPSGSQHPQLDALKAQLAALSPEQRQKMLAAFSELVRKRLQQPNQP